MTNFQPLEVVGRSSDTQPQVVKHLNNFTQQDTDETVKSDFQLLEVVDRSSEEQLQVGKTIKELSG